MLRLILFRLFGDSVYAFLSYLVLKARISDNPFQSCFSDYFFGQESWIMWYYISRISELLLELCTLVLYITVLSTALDYLR